MSDYLCPKCRGHLRVGNELIFSTRTASGTAGLVLLSPEVGDYTVLKHPSYVFKQGEHVDFFCPICHENLEATEYSKNLAKVLAVDEHGKESTLVFSEIVGERCTYKLTDRHLEAFGDDSPHYMNFFGESPRHYH
jgi:hypothetical protein